jgi:NADH-quinone oxidoreductase subunit H
MALGWKILIPASIVWILLIATVKAWRNDTHSNVVYACGGLVIVLILLLVTFWDNAGQRHAAEIGPEPPPVADGGDGAVEGFPVPPLDLPHYHGLDLGEPALGSPPLGSADVTKEVTGAGS